MNKFESQLLELLREYTVDYAEKNNQKSVLSEFRNWLSKRVEKEEECEHFIGAAGVCKCEAEKEPKDIMAQLKKRKDLKPWNSVCTLIIDDIIINFDLIDTSVLSDNELKLLLQKGVTEAVDVYFEKKVEL